jgi:hypothetical protein
MVPIRFIVRGEKDSKPLKTILEYAEERGCGFVAKLEASRLIRVRVRADLRDESVQRTPIPGEVILQAMRWYLRYPLAYEHVAELFAEGGIEVDTSCIWRWVQAYSPELSKRCGKDLKRMNKSYRVDETYIKVKVRTSICIGRSIRQDRPLTFYSPPSATQRPRSGSLRKCSARMPIPFRG